MAKTNLVVVRGIVAVAATKMGLGTPIPGVPSARVVDSNTLDEIQAQARILAKQASDKAHAGHNGHRRKKPFRVRAKCSPEAESEIIAVFKDAAGLIPNQEVLTRVRAAGHRVSNEAVARIRSELGYPNLKRGGRAVKGRKPTFATEPNVGHSAKPTKEPLIPSPAAEEAIFSLSLEAMLPRLSIAMLRLCVQEWNRRKLAALDLATDPLDPLPEVTTQD